MKFEARKMALALTLAFGINNAHAVLERVGPSNNAPSVGGYPAWYMDTTGLAMEFCDPKNQSEVDGGWCLLLPGDVTAPEVFPTKFFDEHFYWVGDATMTAANGGKALLRVALEGAFAVGPAVPGDQIVFSRIRVKLTNTPVPGTYRFIHPFGEEAITCPDDCRGGNLIFFTDDTGITCPPGQFDCAMNGRLGPFLLPSTTPGGPEMAPLTATNPTPDTDPAHFGGVFAPTTYPGNGKAYIADPARIGPVTGSSLPNFIDSTGASRNHNIFRIEGPPGSGLGIDPATGASVDYIETTDFSLQGRVFTDTVPSRVLVDRASYARNASGQKVDVYATAFETGQPRIPAQPRPPVVAPQLSFFDAPCAGVLNPVTLEIQPPFSAPAGANEIQMFASQGSILHWGQTAPVAIPPSVCVKDGSARDAAGNLVPLYQNEVVTDEVNVTEALYDRSAGTLSVSASSSDEIAPPTLTLAFGTFRGDLVNGQISVPNLLAPPSDVRVFSSAFGSDEFKVKTTFASVAPPTIPVANNDSFTFAEDSGAQTLAVLANDSNAAGGTVSITGAPRLGAAVVDPGTGSIVYTSNLNASGTDNFTYTVTVGTRVSNTANVTLNITPVNDAPTAANDTGNAVLNWVRSINVLANDSDPDGASDLASAVLVTGPAAGTTVSGVSGGAGGIFSFVPARTGPVSFTYRAVDKSGVQSANTATVTVQVAAAEQVNFSRAEYTRASSRLRVIGTIAPAMGQTLDLVFVNASGVVLGNIAAGLAVDALGNFTFDQSGIALPTGAVSVRATTHNSDNANSTVRAQSLSIK